MPRREWNGQFVWPREGPKGRTPRSFFDAFRSIMSDTGPDIFITRKNDNTPIKIDQWANWDGYHYPLAQHLEATRSYSNGLYSADRTNQRYDPYTRTYRVWESNDGWSDGAQSYPFLTAYEHDGMARTGNVPRQARWEWAGAVPKRFRPEYDYFWQDAHRAGQHIRYGRRPELPDVDPGLRPDPGSMSWKNHDDECAEDEWRR